MNEAKYQNKMTNYVYLIAFLTAVHYAFIVYINSSFLENYIAKEKIGLLYTVASICSILVISNLSKILKRWGQLKTVVTVLTIDLVSVLLLTATSSPLFSKTIPFTIGDSIALVESTSKWTPWIPAVVIIAFLAFQVSIVLNRLILDIYLEEFSKNSETGRNRGWFLTAMNLAFVLSPIIVGKIIADSFNQGFWKVYLISAIFIVLTLAVIVGKLSHVRDIRYHSPAILDTLKKILADKNIFSIFGASLLLEFFYSWMVIYTPIYLNETMGFSWKEIGTMFSLMLTAFVILQLPLGKLADKYLGEKEILTAGFIIIAVSTSLLTFIDSNSFVIWTLALFATRVGASAIEVMNDTYFFKKVKAIDSDIISFFRNAGPIAYIVGPAVASILLYFIDYKYLFLVLGIIMFSGIKFSLAIKDTL